MNVTFITHTYSVSNPTFEKAMAQTAATVCMINMSMQFLPIKSLLPDGFFVVLKVVGTVGAVLSAHQMFKTLHQMFQQGFSSESLTPLGMAWIGAFVGIVQWGVPASSAAIASTVVAFAMTIAAFIKLHSNFV